MPAFDEATLIDKLRAIEALHAGATSPGERAAAANARERILARLAEIATADLPVEFRLTVSDPWSKRLLMALLRRYGIRPFRYRRQRRTTVMVHAPRRFIEEILWPEFEALNSTLRTYLDDVTNRVIAEAVHADVSDAAEVDEPPSLPWGPPYRGDDD
jgi:hypothetical protein